MTRFFRMLTLGVALAFVWQVDRTSAQIADPASGTWELNVSKSKYSPGPPPKSETRTYEVKGESLKYTSKGIDADGKPTLVQITGNYDGKDYPMTGSPDADAISYKRINISTLEFTQKRANKVVGTGTRVVSKDGKELTVTYKGTNAKGQAINYVQVFEKR
jgi:hypothetical protein